jgi:hypothetical protein
MSRFTAADVD